MPEIIGNKTSLLGRLQEHFNKFPSSRELSIRGKELDDETVVGLRMDRSSGNKYHDNCIVNCNPYGVSNGNMEFSVNDYGLLWIRLPYHEVQIGDAIISIIESTFHDMRFPNYERESNTLEKRYDAAILLIDWIDKMLKEKKYSFPPISINTPIL